MFYEPYVVFERKLYIIFFALIIQSMGEISLKHANMQLSSIT